MKYDIGSGTEERAIEEETRNAEYRTVTSHNIKARAYITFTLRLTI